MAGSVKAVHSPRTEDEGAVRAARCPLSSEQRRLWLLHQLEPDGCGYNVPIAVRLRGVLHLDALREALQALAYRHEPLRTRFAIGDAGPEQLITDTPSFALPLHDVASWGGDWDERALLEMVAEEARRPFDLAAGAMLRARLIRLRRDDHVLQVTIHHIATDGWSMGIFARELSALYAARAAGQVADLPSPPIRYRDYALRQHEWLRTEERETQLAYWKARLAGAPRMVPLPTDRPRPGVSRHQGARETATLSFEVTRAVKVLSRRLRVTLFMTLLATFASVLHRYSATEDIVVGTAVAGRRWIDTEQLIGFFVNTLVLRLDAAGDPPFHEFLARVRDTVIDAYDHQDLPFEQLVEALRPPRDSTRTPLFNVMFVLQNTEQPDFALPGLTATPLEVESGSAKFDLTVSVTDTPQGLHVVADYDADLYRKDTIKRMLRHYELLLQGIVEDSTRVLSRLRLATEAERRAVHRWNETRRDFPADDGLAALFDAQATRTPQAVAVTGGQSVMTYGELRTRANRLADRLRRCGVGPDMPVGVLLPRGVDLVVALLGVLKAGGAYLPLDPSHPQERLAFMLRDARPAAVLTGRVIRRLPVPGIPVIAVDELGGVTEPADAPVLKTGGDNLAYVMYTSGSMGEPKAVAVPQRAVTRLVVNTDYVTITPTDVIAQLSSPSFDAATFEIWGALLNGARLAVLPHELLLSPADLGAALRKSGITMLFLTTAVFNLVARTAPEALAPARTVLFGGEVASPASADAILRYSRPERLVHVYGPTEATTFASWHLVKSVAPGATTIPIGRPIANTEIYLLDGDLQPVGPGVPGEIHIGGPGVARGYLNQAALTDEKFIPHPFGGPLGARVYRTGDLGRYRPDGSIEFLGRTDEQVKLRGYRVEPGEIDAALRRHPDVQHTLTVLREDVPGDKRLVTYVVASAASAADLRDFLRAQLPDYMVPTRIVPLDGLPLTPNGKIDRTALPAPSTDSCVPDADFVEPASLLEYQLQELWEDVLRVRPIGATADFFDLGGHSLLAVQLLQAIESATGRRLPLGTLFEYPTIRRLAEAVRQHPVAADTAVAVLHRGGHRRPLFFMDGALAGVALYCRNLARALGPDQPMVVLHPLGVDGAAVPDSIEEMADRHLRLVRSMQPHGPYRLGGYCNGGLVAFEIARRLHAQGEQVEFLGLLDASAAGARLGRRCAHYLIDAIGGLRGLTRQHRLGQLVRLHQRAGALRDRLCDRTAYYIQRLPQLRNLGRDEWRGLFARKRAWFRGLLERRRSRTRLKAETLTADVPPCSLSSYPDLEEAYRRLIVGYSPGQYRGTVTLFRSAAGPASRPDLWWGLVARAVDVQEIPGNHLTCITRHVGVLGERLGACLRSLE